MKYLVISDIHGSLYYLKQVFSFLEIEKINKIILLGDLYYHGPRNLLPKDYQPMEVANLLNQYAERIICVRGNCDAEVDQMISKFKIRNQLTLKINGKKFFFTHGHHYHLNHLKEGVDLMVYGHFHTGYIKKADSCICVNTGSISLPKQHTPHSFVIIDQHVLYLKDLNNQVIDQIQF